MYNTDILAKYIFIKKNIQVWDYINDVKNEYRNVLDWIFYFIFNNLYIVFFFQIKFFNKSNSHIMTH